MSRNNISTQIDLDMDQLTDPVAFMRRIETPVHTNSEKVEVLKRRNYTEPKLLEKVKEGTLTEEDFADYVDYDHFDMRNIMAFVKTGEETCLFWQ